MDKEKIRLNRYAVYLMKSGIILAGILLSVSLVLHIGAGRFGDYYEYMIMSKELILCARQCFAVTSFGAFALRFLINN